jgi:hypothetical protein
MSNTITNQHIFDELTRLRLEIKSDIKELRSDVDSNTGWRNQITGKLTIVFIFIGAGVNLMMDWVQERIK